MTEGYTIVPVIPGQIDYNSFFLYFESLFLKKSNPKEKKKLVAAACKILKRLDKEPETNMFIEHFSAKYNIEPSLFQKQFSKIEAALLPDPEPDPVPEPAPVTEDVLTAPVDQEPYSDEKFETNDFFINNNVYFSKTFNSKGDEYINRESNFIMEILFHFNDGTNNTKRLIKLQHHTGTINLIEILSSEMGSEKFETILKSHKCSFFGNGKLLNKIFAALMDRETEAIYLADLGYNPHLNIYVFSNAIVFPDSSVVYANSHGIVLHEKTCYYLPAFSANNINNLSFADMRRFVFRPGNIYFKDFVSLMVQTFGLKAVIGISFLISCIFRDIIIKETKFFPYLFLFGQAGTGKSTFIGNLTGLLGEHDPGCPMANSTPKYLGRQMSQRKNAMVYLKEWENNIVFKNPEIGLLLKNTYDGASYGIADSSSSKKTISFLVESGVIIDGNELPTNNQAVFDRNIILDFFQNRFNETEIAGHQKLIDENNKGLGYVFLDIYKQRDHFLYMYKDTYREVLAKIKADLSIILSDNNILERIAKHTAFLYAPIKILNSLLEWNLIPEELDTLVNKLYDDAIDKLNILNEISPVNIFWAAVGLDRSREFPEILPEKHYIRDDNDNILYLKLKEVMHVYIKYCTQNKIIGNSSTMKKLLLNEQYFIKGDNKDRGVSYTKKNFGSCYKFSYVVSEQDPTKIIIGNNELNL